MIAKNDYGVRRNTVLSTGKSAIAAAVLLSAVHNPAAAVRTQDDAMSKSSDLTETLSDKMAGQADAASEPMAEMGEVMGKGAVTAETCTRLDALIASLKTL